MQATVLVAGLVCFMIGAIGQAAAQGAAVNPACICTQEFAPVCTLNGVEYSNECQAACVGVTEFTPGPCAGPPPACKCPASDAESRVCANGKFTFGTECEARCAGATKLTPGDCANADGSPGLLHPCNLACIIDNKPVCGSNGVTYPSKCAATCVLGAGQYTPGPCPVLPKPLNGGDGCPCTREFVPVCGSDGHTYPNKCIAECILGKDNWKAGVCPSRCSACSTQLDPVCGSDGTTYANACVAECRLGPGKWTAGECNPFLGCPNAGAVDCFRDPCAGGCKANPDAKCFSSYCEDYKVLGVVLQPCQAVWFDPETIKPVDCDDVTDPQDSPVELENLSDSCPPGHTARCLVDACSLEPKTCAANPDAKCYSNNCNAIYRGEVLLQCAAYWADADGNLVDCNAPPSVDSIDSCESRVRCLRNPCDDQPATCAADATAKCVPSYCDNALYRGTQLQPCQAYWVNADGDIVEDCSLPTVDSFDSCQSRVRCLRNPCDGEPKTCAADPTAQCKPNYCDNVLYRGTKLMPCQAYWLNPGGDIVEDCNLPTVDSIDSCESRVRCLRNPCDGEPKTCAADPTARCKPSYCDNVLYRGTELMPCQAYWVNAEGDLVDCSAVPKKRVHRHLLANGGGAAVEA